MSRSVHDHLFAPDLRVVHQPIIPETDQKTPANRSAKCVQDYGHSNAAIPASAARSAGVPAKAALDLAAPKFTTDAMR